MYGRGEDGFKTKEKGAYIDWKRMLKIIKIIKGDKLEC